MDPLISSVAIGAGSALLGGHISARESRRANEMNVRQQERFAKHGIQWKVEDAKRAGVSPEFALGASGASFNPTSTASGKGDMIADAGQNIARSVLATGSAEDRKVDAALKVETLRGMKIDNDIKHNQLTGVNRPGNPPFPHANGNVIPGQGNTPVVSDVALERVGQHPTARHSEGASIPAVGWAETKDGGLKPIPSQGVKERIEDQLIPETMWATEHLLGPNIGRMNPPPKSALPKGAKFWRWSVSRQAYYPSKGKKSSMLPPAAAYYYLRDKYRKHFGGK